MSSKPNDATRNENNDEFTAKRVKPEKVKISVNNKPVDLLAGIYTGAEIKTIAIKQKVEIEQDFVLSLKPRAGSDDKENQTVGDDDKVEIAGGEDFNATAVKKPNPKKVKISVNNKPVDILTGIYTGAEIKAIAIEQKVEIEKDFILSLKPRAGSDDKESRIIGDDDEVEITGGEEFKAIPDDEASFPPLQLIGEDEMAENVVLAIQELKDDFPNSTIVARSDNNGGADVILDGIELGTPYTTKETWFGFNIPYNYPYADVYPHFTDPNIKRGDKDIKDISGISYGYEFWERPAMQLSRRSTKKPESFINASAKLLGVKEWLLKI